LPDHPFAVFIEGNNGRTQASAFRSSDYGGLPAFHYGNHAVGGAEVNADDFSHGSLLDVETISVSELIWFLNSQYT
jgi:hypothetical protein